MRISRVAPADLGLIEPLRRALWPDSGIEELAATVAERPDFLVLVALEDAAPVGFAEIGMRHDHVNGCETSPVAFLEGIFVDPAHRRSGIGRALVDAAERWATAAGVHELASDALLDNAPSHAFHEAIGFRETERVIFFRRPLAAAG